MSPEAIDLGQYLIDQTLDFIRFYYSQLNRFQHEKVESMSPLEFAAAKCAGKKLSTFPLLQWDPVSASPLGQNKTDVKSRV